MTVTRTLLIYDGSRRPFRAAAALVASRVDDLEPVRWGSDGAQAFLEAQFDGRPFVFALVEGDTVHVGAATVGRLLRRRGAPDRVATLFERVYLAAGDPFGRVVHGREPADIDGAFDVAEAARPHLESLRAGGTVPVEPAGSGAEAG